MKACFPPSDSGLACVWPSISLHENKWTRRLVRTVICSKEGLGATQAWGTLMSQKEIHLGIFHPEETRFQWHQSRDMIFRADPATPPWVGETYCQCSVCWVPDPTLLPWCSLQHVVSGEVAVNAANFAEINRWVGNHHQDIQVWV